MKPTFVELVNDSFWVRNHTKATVNLQGVRHFRCYDIFEFDHVSDSEVYPGYSRYGLEFDWKNSRQIIFEWNTRADRDRSYQRCLDAIKILKYS